jgi:hypothetical protein
MPIGGYVPSSAISKPGVIANSAARPSSPYNGQVVYQTDTGQAFVWNGSSWVLLSTGTTGDIGLVKVIPTGATNGTVAANGTVTIGNAVSSVTVSGAFSSLYDVYQIIISGGAGSTGLGLNLTFGSAAANYYLMRSYVDWASATYADASVNNGSSFITAGAASTSGISFDLRVMNPNLAKVTAIYGQWAFMSTGGEGQQVIGYLNDTTQHTAFTITCSAGSITGGSIRVYGYRN